MFWDNDALVGATNISFLSRDRYFIASPTFYHGGKLYAVAHYITESGLLCADYTYHTKYSQRPALKY